MVPSTLPSNVWQGLLGVLRAKTQEMKAQLVLAEAEALKEGNIGVMDYYRLQNLKADTSMKNAISNGGDDID